MMEQSTDSKKVYAGFEDLVASNKNLFKLLEKSARKGTLKAIWDARQGEIDHLKTTIDSKSEQLEQTERAIAKLKEVMEIDAAENNKLVQEHLIAKQKEEEKSKKALSDVRALKQKLKEAFEDKKKVIEMIRAEKTSIEKTKEESQTIKQQAEQLKNEAEKVKHEAEKIKHEAAQIKQKAHEHKLNAEEQRGLAKKEIKEAEQLKDKTNLSQRDVIELMDYVEELKKYSAKTKEKNKELVNKIGRLEDEKLQLKVQTEQACDDLDIYKEDIEQAKVQHERLRGDIQKLIDYSEKLKIHIKKSKQHANTAREHAKASNENEQRYKKEAIRLKKDSKAQKAVNDKLVSSVKIANIELIQTKEVVKRLEEKLLKAQEDLGTALKSKKQLEVDLEQAANNAVVSKTQIKQLCADNDRLAHELIQLGNAFEAVKKSIGKLQVDVADTGSVYQATNDILLDKQNKDKEQQKDFLQRQRFRLFDEWNNQSF